MQGGSELNSLDLPPPPANGDQSTFTLTDLLASIPSRLTAPPSVWFLRRLLPGYPLLHDLHRLPNGTPAAWAGRGLCSRKGS